MRLSTFNNFGALNSKPVFEAFTQGARKLGLDVSSHDTTADVAVIWSMLWKGRMAGNQQVWQHFQRHKRPVLVLEVGMLDRGQTWKLGIGGTGLSNYSMNDLDLSRPSKLNVCCKPWTYNGQDIVIALQRTDSQQWIDQSSNWLSVTVDQIKRHTSRRIIIRPHPRQSVDIPKGCTVQIPQKITSTYDDFDFASGLATAWAVVNWCSGPGVRAVLSGIPAFVGPHSLAAPVGNLDLNNIENPVRPDRESWLVALSHTEWTLEELASGYPLMRLLPALKSF
jgi:hypothetical protein